MNRIRAIAGWQSPEQVALQIKTVPADEDPYALRIARHFATWLGAAGVDARVVPMAEEELLRQVLLAQNFDVFVARTPGDHRAPDDLYSLLHSTFAASAGWQNPFGYANLEVDELLETQRVSTGRRRRRAIEDLQREIARSQPFSVVAFPDSIRAVRNDYYGNWLHSDLDSSAGYLALRRVETEGTDGGRDGSDLRVATTDQRVTQNLNPLAVEFRDSGTITGLLYDPLGRRYDGETVRPWLADGWTFTDADPGPRMRIRLREDVVWHDGQTLTAADVAFTYAFLSDTAREDEESTVPAPRFQGQTSLVTDAQAIDRRTVELQFVDCTPTVAVSALTVPVLPRHVWAERTAPATLGGIEIADEVTEALVTNNIPPIGSGPLVFVRNTPREVLALERFDEHFLHRESTSDFPHLIRDGVAFDQLIFRVVGSDSTAVEMVSNGEVDATASSVGADTVPRIGRARDLDLLVNRSNTYYVIGYNVRRSPLTNPRFRNVLAHLVDKEFLVEGVFDNYAEPAASPLAHTDWLPADLEWDDVDPVTPFLGTDGDVDVENVREEFRAIGYRYDGDALVEG